MNHHINRDQSYYIICYADGTPRTVVLDATHAQQLATELGDGAYIIVAYADLVIESASEHNPERGAEEKDPHRTV
jgi:hypothetical protein